MIASVDAALCACGRLNAGTPFEIASTPVSAVAPDENAFSNTKSPTAPAVEAASWIGSTSTSTAGHPPRHWPRPSTSNATIDSTKPYVGIANSMPDSFEPRRFARVTKATKKTHSTTACSLATGSADPIANTPATIETDHGHHVVEQQRRGGDETGELPQVLLAHDVGAATARVGAHRLAVRGDHERHQQRHGDGDRHHVLLRGRRRHREHQQDLARSRTPPTRARRKRRPAARAPSAATCARGARWRRRGRA